MTVLGALPLGLQGDRVDLRRMEEDEVRFEGKYPTQAELKELGVGPVDLDSFEGGMAVLKARHAKAEKDRQASWKAIDELLSRNEIAQAARVAERAKYPAGQKVAAEMTPLGKVLDEKTGEYVDAAPLIPAHLDDPARDYDALGPGQQAADDLSRPLMPEGQGGSGVGDGQGGPEGPPAPAGLTVAPASAGAVENAPAGKPDSKPALPPRPQRRQTLGFTPTLSQTQPQRLAAMAPVVEGPKASLWEVANASFGEMWYVENFNAERRARDDVARDMIRQVYEATGVQLEQPVRGIHESDYITYRDKYPDAAKSYGSEWLEDLRVAEFDAAIASLRQQFPDKAAQLPAQGLNDATLALQRKAFTTAEDARARAAGPVEGFAGGLMGSMAGSFGDPLQVATLPVGFGARTIVGAAMKEMAVNVGITGGMELVRDKAAWKDVTGREYTVEDFFGRVGTAAAFSAIMGGGGKFGQQATGRLMFDRTAFEVFRAKYDALPPDHPFRADETFRMAMEDVERSFRDLDDIPEGVDPVDDGALKRQAREAAAEPNLVEPNSVDFEAPDRAQLRALLDAGAQPEEIWATPLAQAADAPSIGVPTHRYGDPIPEGRRYRLPDPESNAPREAGLYETIDHLADVARREAGPEGPAQERRVIVVMGYPGAGKSTFIKRFAERARAAVPDADYAKTLIPEYEGGIGNQRVHGESLSLREEVMADLVREGDNFILESIGRDPKGLLEIVDGFKEMGYSVELVHVRVAPDEAVRRQWRRYLSSGRPIAPSVARSMLGQPEAGWDALVDSQAFSRYLDIDYSGAARDAKILNQTARTAAGDPDGGRAAGLEADLREGQGSEAWDIADEVNAIARDAALADKPAPPPPTASAPYPASIDPEIARAGEDPTPENLVRAAEIIERDTARPPSEPKRLRTFLRAMGGLKDDGGVIKQMLDVGSGRPDRMLNNKTGMDPDLARVRAWEEGYFYSAEPPELQEFIDAIADDIGDHSPRYRLDDLQAVDEWSAYQERQRQLDAGDIPFPEEDARFSRDPDLASADAGGFSSAAVLKTAARVAFGEGADKLFDVIRAPQWAPADAIAVTNKRTGRVSLIEGRVNGAQVKGLLLHEIGAHAGIEAIVGRTRWDDLLATVSKRLEAGEGRWADVKREMPADIPEPQRVEEALGYFLELNPELVAREPWWQQLLNAVRDWAARALPWLKRDLSDAEIVDLARGAVAQRIPQVMRSFMSKAERLERAKAQGFDIETPLYHGTKSGEFQAFDLSRAGENAGEAGAIYFAHDREFAHRWAGLHTPSPSAHAYVVEAYARLNNPKIVQGDGSPRFDPLPADEINAAREAGHDGVIFRNFDDGGEGVGDYTVVFDPKNVRRVDAVFDPAQTDSSNLRYSRTGKPQPAPAGTPASNPKQAQPGQAQAPQGPPSPALARQRFIDALTKRVQKRLDGEWQRFRNGSGEQDAGEFLQAVLDYQGQGSGLTRSVDGLRKTIVARSLAEIEAMLFHFRAGTAGRRVNKADIGNFVKEMFGEDSKDAAAKALAQAVTPGLEKLRQRFNRAGGQIGKLDNWGLPQAHNALALRNWIEKNGGKVAGRAALKQKLYDSLDVSRMRDVHTGKPMTGPEVWNALDSVIADMVTDGWATRAPSRVRVTPGMLANRRADHRFLIFKDADTWLGWQREFGQGDPITAVVAHVERMARDIAAMEVLGPNPETTIEWLKQKALHEGGKAATGAPAALPPRVVKRKDPGAYVTGKVKRMDDMWLNYTGSVNVPVNEWLARRSASMRNLLTSATLGSAILSAMPTDPVFQAFARSFAGTSHAKSIELMLRNIKDPRHANQMAMIMDHSLSAFGDEAVQAREFSSWGVSSALATQVLAASGLTPWTRQARKVFGMGFLADMGNMAGDGWADLDPIFQRTFKRYGLGPQEWDAIRNSQLTPDGFVSPAEVEKLGGGDLADRMLHMILQETEYAVPSGTLRSRSFMRGRDQAGTFWGEVRQSARMFLSFGATLPMLYGYRLAHQMRGGKPMTGALQFAALAGTLMVGGYFAMQLKNIRDGKDLNDPRDPKIWQAAFLQGGGLGVYGDFLFSNLNRMSRTLGETISGAQIGFLSDVQKATLGELAKGEKGDVVTAVTQLMLQNTPGSSLWYFKGAWDKWIEDGFRHLTSPTASETIRRRAQTLKRDTGQGMFWRSGQLLPERAPAFVTPPPRQEAAQ